MLGLNYLESIELHRLHSADDFARQIEHDMLEDEIRACQEYLN